MMLPDESMRATDLVAMLRRHYLPDGRPPGGIFAAEIESPDLRRRADAIWAPWTIAGGAGLMGHEIKVSRSDVLTELADPMKAEPWARYCSRWWLVLAHPSLVDGLVIPEAWGVMAPPSGRRTRSMTVVREAPPLKPSDTGPAWRRIATWEHARSTDRLRDLEWKKSSAEAERDRLRRELDERQIAGEGRASPQALMVGRVVAELERQKRWGSDFQVEDVVAAIMDLAEYRRLAQSARQEVEWIIAEARRLSAPMGRIAKDLEKLNGQQYGTQPAISDPSVEAA